MKKQAAIQVYEKPKVRRKGVHSKKLKPIKKYVGQGK